ncbi:MAG TPA: GIY-YIG nuclease family protein, partial [Longimicrobium sp.]|nr:GIY-YIG nuclease family protein [Longimicrobium sp.]
VAHGVGRIARRARRLGRFRARGGPRLDVFATRGFRLLVRPTGEMEGEIVAVTPVAGEMEEEVRSLTASLTWYGPFRFAASAKDVLSPITRGAKVPGLSTGGIYLFEKLGGKGWEPVYVGKADDFAKRLGTRREYLRQLGVALGRYRVYLGIPATAGTSLHALEHAVVRSVLRGANKAGAAADTDPDAARRIPFTPLRNLTPRVAFQVGAGGLSVTHAPAAGHAIPAYLRSGTGKKGQWYELPE